MTSNNRITISDVTHTSNTPKEADVTIVSDWNGNVFHVQLDRRASSAPRSGVAIPRPAQSAQPATGLKLDPAKLAAAQEWHAQISRDFSNA